MRDLDELKLSKAARSHPKQIEENNHFRQAFEEDSTGVAKDGCSDDAEC